MTTERQQQIENWAERLRRAEAQREPIASFASA